MAGYRPKKWPTYALEALEDTLALLDAIDANARDAQVLIRNNERMGAIIVVGDVRDAARAARDKLSRAKSGDYR